MKKALIFLAALGLLASLAACAAVPPAGISVDGPVDGDDWHSWGVYDFCKIGDISAAVRPVSNEDRQHVGYDVHMDGEALGAQLCEIRCWDGGYIPDDISAEDHLIFEDYNGDGKADIGAALRSGDIMWYLQAQDGQNGVYFSFAEVQQAEADARKDWHDWGIYSFRSFDDGMTVAISAIGEPGYESGFNVYADLGPERGARLCSILWSDGGFERGYFELNDCILLQDYNGDGLGDIGVRNRYGDIMWYFRDESRNFAYSETQAAADVVDLSFLAGTWKLDDEEYSMQYDIDATGRSYEYSAGHLISAGLILPAGEENGYAKYEMIDNSGETHDFFWLISETQMRFGAFDHPDQEMVGFYNRVDQKGE